MHCNKTETTKTKRNRTRMLPKVQIPVRRLSPKLSRGESRGHKSWKSRTQTILTCRDVRDKVTNHFCVCRLHAVAGRAGGSGQWRKRIRGVDSRRCAIQIDNLYLYFSPFSSVMGFLLRAIRHLYLYIRWSYMYGCRRQRDGASDVR